MIGNHICVCKCNQLGHVQEAFRMGIVRQWVPKCVVTSSSAPIVDNDGFQTVPTKKSDPCVPLESTVAAAFLSTSNGFEILDSVTEVTTTAHDNLIALRAISHPPNA
ncbi:unnamed protein product [Amaranthus hypochondriacus]